MKERARAGGSQAGTAGPRRPLPRDPWISLSEPPYGPTRLAEAVKGRRGRPAPGALCWGGPGTGGARAVAEAAGRDRVNRRARPVPHGAATATASARGLEFERDEACHSGCWGLLLLGLDHRDLRVQSFGKQVEPFARSFLPGHS